MICTLHTSITSSPFIYFFVNEIYIFLGVFDPLCVLVSPVDTRRASAARSDLSGPGEDLCGHRSG